jgi:hypothetical protein
MFMAHRSRDSELQEDERCRAQRPPAQSGMRFVVGPALLHKSPAGHNGKKRDRDKKRLCKQGMKHANFILDENHSQSAE